MAKIILFSRPIRSGKTTELFQTMHRFEEASGILCPDNANGVREIFLIESRTYHLLQVPDWIKGETLSIGRFHFLLSGFEKARHALLEAMNKGAKTIVVDEVGKLEINRGEGLEPALSILLSHYSKPETQGILILVVRDYLVEEVIAHYQLKDFELVNDLSRWTLN